MVDTIFLFPYESIKQHSCIVLYGAGRVGKDYYSQIKATGYCKVAAWVDSDPCVCLENPLLSTVEEGLKVEYQLLLIAVSDDNVSDQIKQSIVDKGGDENLIFWKTPDRKDILPCIMADSFITGVCNWRREKFIKNDEPFWELFRDAAILFEAYKRVFIFGRYDIREWYINENTKAAYLNNAKVACTSLKASVRGYEMDVGYQEINKELSKQALTDGDEKLITDFFKFTFVRNPFARLVSCYRNKYYTDIGQLGEEPKDLYFGVTRYLMGSLQDVTSFKEFVEKVYLIPLQWQDRHFRSQYDLIYKDGSCTVDFIGRFEDLPTAYDGIRKKYGFSQLKHHNNSQEIGWMEYYDIETAELVYEKYKMDIVTFGYENEYHKLLEFCMIAEKRGTKYGNRPRSD